MKRVKSTARKADKQNVNDVECELYSTCTARALRNKKDANFSIKSRFDGAWSEDQRYIFLTRVFLCS